MSRSSVENMDISDPRDLEPELCRHFSRTTAMGGYLERAARRHRFTKIC